MSNLNVQHGSMDVATVLTIVFVVLKLTGLIHWSWWWVLSPLWIGFAFTFGVLVAVFVIVFLISLWEELFKKHR